MAGLDPAIQAAALHEDCRSAPRQFPRRHDLDGRVKPGHDDGEWFNLKAAGSSVPPPAADCAPRMRHANWGTRSAPCRRDRPPASCFSRTCPPSASIKAASARPAPSPRFGGRRRRPRGSVFFPKPKSCQGAQPAYGGAPNGASLTALRLRKFWPPRDRRRGGSAKNGFDEPSPQLNRSSRHNSAF